MKRNLAGSNRSEAINNGSSLKDDISLGADATGAEGEGAKVACRCQIR